MKESGEVCQARSVIAEHDAMHTQGPGGCDIGGLIVDEDTRGCR
jgi:hypothetical protein